MRKPQVVPAGPARRRDVIVPAAGVVPGEDHRGVLVVVAASDGMRARSERHIDRADPAGTRRAQRPGVIGIDRVRHHEGDLRQTAVRDVVENRSRRRNDVAIPIGAVANLPKRIVNVDRRVEAIVGATGVVLPPHVRGVEQIGDRRLVEARKDAGVIIDSPLPKIGTVVPGLASQPQIRSFGLPAMRLCAVASV